MTNAAAAWYDDGQNQLRWWDGTQWTAHVAPLPTQQATVPPMPAAHSHLVSEVKQLPNGGIEVEVSLPTKWPLWFLIQSDPGDSREVLIRVFPGFNIDTVPGFDDPEVVAEVEMEDWEDVALSLAIHSTQQKLMEALGAEMSAVLQDVAGQVHAAIDRHSSS